MPRRPDDNVQIGLRVREAMRTRLQREAKKNGVPVNREICNRLERSLQSDAAQTLEEVAAAVTTRLRKAVERA
jgi:antitoxin component of RelBE/YafQ-DinJ toxin-antitoxin module